MTTMVLRKPTSEEVASLEGFDRNIKPLKERYLELREEHLAISAEQRTISKQIQDITDKRERRKAELLAAGVDPAKL